MPQLLTGRRAAILMVALAAAAVGLAWYIRSRAVSTEDLLVHLPRQDAAVVHIDVAGLRAAGFLDLLRGGAKVVEEGDYRAFVQQTKFEYQRDLDTVLASFAPNGQYMLLRGRFDWNSLRDYALKNGGGCDGDLCRMNSSQPGRHISYFPFRANVMALAVSGDRSAAHQLRDRQPGPPLTHPGEPVWAVIPGSVLRAQASGPSGTRLFARALQGADRLTLALAGRTTNYELLLEAQCAGESEAAALHNQLVGITSLLQGLIRRERQAPNVADLSGVLAAGNFRRENTTVKGTWPIEKAFVEAVAAQ